MNFAFLLVFLWKLDGVHNAEDEDNYCHDARNVRFCNYADRCAGVPRFLVNSIKRPQTGRVLKVCLGKRIRIYHDPSLRIPLAAEVTLNRAEILQLTAVADPRPNWKKYMRRQIKQASTDDYRDAKRSFCVENSDHTLETHESTPCWTNQGYDCNREDPPSDRYGIEKGHLIAHSYLRNIDTMYYVNAVPQFGDFNRRAWRSAEAFLKGWGIEICGNLYADARMYIMVGAIPSTLLTPGRPVHPEWLGRYGFGSFDNAPPERNFRNKGISRDRVKTHWYRVNVPHAMWTVACCVADFRPENNYTPAYIKNIAFGGFNTPRQDEQKVGYGMIALVLYEYSFGQIFTGERPPFPLIQGCNHHSNYEAGPFRDSNFRELAINN